MAEPFTLAMRGIGEFRIERSPSNARFWQLWRVGGRFPLASGPISFIAKIYRGLA